ncbi:MAG TPA: polysaccharide biosynthesis/export family protein [Candidatus Eisenbacteria bacterium]|nr:polysaccharide biosynthesis/export family protein [Candidatus Eisenbacteria bacterium]
MKMIASALVLLLAAAAPAGAAISMQNTDYQVGVGDVLEISVLQPDQFTTVVTVAPDGSVSFPYINSVAVKGKTLPELQDDIQRRLADGYIKYPVVTVYLKESRSRKYLVSGEVVKPGAYPLEDRTTVLRAISIAGGFTKFGSASRVKVLREKGAGGGYEAIPVDLKRALDGHSENDLSLIPGDMVVVSEGIF